MRLYGSTRRSRLTCAYGCCGSKESYECRHTVRGRAAKKAARKRARRPEVQECAA